MAGHGGGLDQVIRSLTTPSYQHGLPGQQDSVPEKRVSLVT
jgi:hypothetical protein